MGLEVITKPNEVKIPIDFQEVKIKIHVNILEEGEDQTNNFSHLSRTYNHSALYKTFPFSFLSGETRIYGDFWVKEDWKETNGKSPFYHGVRLFNLTSFLVSMNMNMKMTNENGQGERYETKTGLVAPVVSSGCSANVLRSKIIKEMLPYNNQNAYVFGEDCFLNDTILNSNSNSHLNCEIKFYINPIIESAKKSNLKSIFCDDAISHLDKDKNFTLICDGQMFHFNKTLLSILSEVFGTMVQASNTKEALTNSVEIDDFTPDTIEAFQRVAFGNDEIKDEDLTPDLLMFAQKYLMKPLVTKIKLKLLDSLTNENIFDIIKTAYLIDDEDMINEASDYLMKKMAQLESTEEWKIFGKNNPDCMIKTLTVMCKKGNNAIGNKNFQIHPSST